MLSHALARVILNWNNQPKSETAYNSVIFQSIPPRSFHGAGWFIQGSKWKPAPPWPQFWASVSKIDTDLAQVPSVLTHFLLALVSNLWPPCIHFGRLFEAFLPPTPCRLSKDEVVSLNSLCTRNTRFFMPTPVSVASPLYSSYTNPASGIPVTHSHRILIPSNNNSNINSCLLLSVWQAWRSVLSACYLILL